MTINTMVRASAGLSALIVAISSATTAFAARTAPAASTSYVALGDSYAAGTGAGSYLNDGTQCHRSLLGYPGLIAKANGSAQPAGVLGRHGGRRRFEATGR